MVRAAAFFSLILVAATVAGAGISGVPSVTDGDTLRIGPERIRLHGIDAPESAQSCRAGGKTWACGEVATRALRERIGRRPVECSERDRDRYGRIVAVCRVGGADLNAWMVAQGWAVAYRKYSTDYVSQETAAKAASDVGDCRIKGNISKKGIRIYHVPSGASYAKTRIDTAKGERWFCTEAEARSARWQRAKR